jgi:hypothetical protein
MPLGNLVGMAIMPTMFTNKSNVGEQDTKDGMMWAFIVMLLVIWRCVLLTSSLGNVRILKEVVSEINEPPPRHRH